MKQFASRLLKDQSGATAIEYGLIVALIAVVIIGYQDDAGRISTPAFPRPWQAIGSTTSH